MKQESLDKLLSLNERKTTDINLNSSRIIKLPLELQKFKRLKILNLFNNQITEIPQYFNDFEALHHLNLGNNKFIVFPSNLENCNIKTLLFKDNRLTDLSGIESLSENLEKLDLSANKLDILRIDFNGFRKLKHVDFSQNSIKKFPKSILSEGIQTLKLSGNEISILPKEIGKLKSLRELDLSYNNIEILPDEICELTELRVLNLVGNKIRILPKTMTKLTKLNQLYLNGNPIGEAPLEISNHGLKAVINYYLHSGVSVKLNEAKLLVVGQGNVGKTFLVNRLISDTVPETDSTTGIDIHKWTLNSNDGSAIRLNAWDFGGQEIYHSTHQFFLTKRSIYLFIWEARKDENQINFDYWLNIIQILSTSSPVLVVMNKMDDRIKEIDEKSLKEKFPNIIGFLKVSAKDGTHIKDLISLINDNVLKLPHIGDKLPKTWSDIREELESIDKNYISYEEYKTICNRFGLNREQSKFISQYYHDLGVFLHFGDNPVLKPIIFLKSEWVTNCVYRILDLKEVILSYGEFTLELLEEHLNDYDSQQISYIIELMKRFELCFSLSRTKFIIPELLRPSSPDIGYTFSDGISMVYKYDFMPAGILPRLTVRLKDSIHENNYWKNGVYIKYDDAFGLIESNQFAKTIKIVIDGKKQAQLLAVIKRELDYINESLNNPSHQIEIMCNCGKCKDSGDPYMFNYDYLIKAKEANFNVVHCQKNLMEVSLKKLIGPYSTITTVVEDEFRFNSTDLLYDLIEISALILERKYVQRLEDLITDNFTDALRLKGYSVSDQTRSGRSLVQSGELDIMIRNSRNMPVAILEAFRLDSFGPGNRSIIEHLNKLLLDYDTNGLPTHFMVVYCQSDNFNKSWVSYQDYIGKLTHHHLYDPKIEMMSFSVKNEYTKRSNIKILSTQHSKGTSFKEVYHLFINMTKDN